MTVEVPPRGTRGSKRPPAPVLRAITKTARFLHRRTGNKMGGVPLMYLTTIGAKTGQQRTVPVMAFPDGDDAWLVVASSGGTATHPAWFYNLAKHPDRVEVEYEGRKTPAVPETLAGEARAAAWARITADQKRFADYETKTDREIPVVRLSAR